MADRENENNKKTISVMNTLHIRSSSSSSSSNSSMNTRMHTAVYLYHSAVNQDFALLPFSPSSSSGTTGFFNNVTAPSSYSDIFSSTPVAFVYSTVPQRQHNKADNNNNNNNNIVPLMAYWSATRTDIQTTTATLDDLNNDYEYTNHDGSGGGDYLHLMDVGFVYSNAEYTPADLRLVPLNLVYSDDEQQQAFDAITSPYNAADLVALFNHNGSTFQDSGTTATTVGWGAQGTCESCNQATSETYPSAGGADCPFVCSTEEVLCEDAIYRVEHDDVMSKSEGGKNFLANMKLAGDIVQTFDSSVHPLSESGYGVHVTFAYWCCYSDEELDIIKDVLDVFDWVPQHVTFDRAAVRIDRPNSDGSSVSHYSLCIFLDEESNERVLKYVGQVERAIEAAGVTVHVPRKQQEPYHSTLAVVDGRTFPVEKALRKINESIPVGSWTGSNNVPLILTKPEW